MRLPGFHIRYENPSLPIPEFEIPEDFEFEDAFAEHLEHGINGTLIVGTDELRFTGVKFMDFFYSTLKLVEQLSSLPDEAPGVVLGSLPELPFAAKIYSWIFGHFVMWLPVIVFATDGAEVRVYTRIWNEDRRGPRLIILPDWGHDDPVIVPLLAVLEELRGFVVRYLDDLVEAMPFIAGDEKYQEYRRRLAMVAA